MELREEMQTGMVDFEMKLSRKGAGFGLQPGHSLVWRLNIHSWSYYK